MADDKQNIEQHILTTRIDVLYDRSKSAIVSLLAISAVYILLQSSQYEWQSLASWYATLIVVMLGRWILTEWYTKKKNSTDSLSLWLKRFRFGILASGIMIGSLSLFFFPRENIYHQMLAILFPIGIAAGTVSMLPDIPSFFIYVITLMMPVVYQSAMMETVYTWESVC